MTALPIDGATKADPYTLDIEALDQVRAPGLNLA